ncbi:MAG: hypothetical protein DMG79_08450 [Acidobacteria bacterium]|nr:MAG: hypothetical protein DMG79_08450 [Acidobacteriota bacterium]
MSSATSKGFTRYEIGDIIFLQEGALFAGAGGEGEQEVALHAGAIFFEPLVRFFGAFCRS